MRGIVSRLAILTLGMTLLGGCAGEPNLITLRPTGQGPDEFAVLPNKPLQSPQNFRDLPTPTPSGANLTDPTPRADAAVALGGSAAATTGGGLQGTALLAHATRYGVAPGIRQTLAVEDLEWRRANDGRLLERLFDVTVYYKAYRPLSLDQYAELERFRRSGIRTPAVPPRAY